MKAAVLHQLGSLPKFEEIDEPKINNQDEIFLNVFAVSVKNLDKARAAGNHYAAYQNLPVVLGMDAVGKLDSGELVFANGITGTLAEKAIINKNNFIVLPNNINIAEAAALPNAALGAGMALKYRAKIKSGDTVLINGATGVTGQMAVQLAKIYGAKNIIATGRNKTVLENLKSIGATEIIQLSDDEEKVLADLKSIQRQFKIDIVIDYLWGKPMELILASIEKGNISKGTHPIKIVTVGEMAGSTINIKSGDLRSSNIEILGSGFGSLSPTEISEFFKNILPELFDLLAQKKITIDTELRSLNEIENVWNEKLESGKRLVITI